MPGLAAVAQLPTGLLAAAPALATRSLAAQRVTRGRFAAVVAVLGQSRLQVLDLGHQLLDLRLQRRNLAPPHPQCGILGFQLSDAFGWGHAPMLSPQRNPA